jgi:hypothetical protein
MASIGTSGDVPRFFRLSVEVGDLDEAVVFYGRLFGVEGRRQAGARAYGGNSDGLSAPSG